MHEPLSENIHTEKAVVIIYFPEELICEIDSSAQTLEIDRESFIRDAVKEYISSNQGVEGR